MLLHHFVFGLLLGWGAAIPIGPMNLEIIRRNLTFGTPYGLALGFGVCMADLTYICLLSTGALTILNHAYILNAFAIIGSCILAWFGYNALRLKSNTALLENKAQPIKSLWRQSLGGYSLTLFSPFTVLFWSSVSTQIAIAAKSSQYAAVYVAVGVLLATLSWSFGLNGVLHLTRHRLSNRVMHFLNTLGGFILLLFAGFGIFHVVKGLAFP